MDQISGLESSSNEKASMAHIIIIVDHLGKGSSLPIAIAISKISQGKKSDQRNGNSYWERFKNARWIRFLA